jgi:hypothetical protein
LWGGGDSFAPALLLRGKELWRSGHFLGGRGFHSFRAFRAHSVRILFQLTHLPGTMNEAPLTLHPNGSPAQVQPEQG